MISIQSRAHKLQTVNVNKTTLSAYDDKRFLLEDGVSSLAYGHHKIWVVFLSSKPYSHPIVYVFVFIYLFVCIYLYFFNKT